jgi:hypothetical protein
MPTIQTESQVQLALQALKIDPKLSIRKTAQLYTMPWKTLTRRHNGISSRTETITNSRNLSPLEEQVIVRRVLDLYEQGFAPGYNVVEDMVNLLRQTRGASHVGPRWASNFIQR